MPNINLKKPSVHDGRSSGIGFISPFVVWPNTAKNKRSNATTGVIGSVIWCFANCVNFVGDETGDKDLFKCFWINAIHKYIRMRGLTKKGWKRQYEYVNMRMTWDVLQSKHMKIFRSRIKAMNVDNLRSGEFRILSNLSLYAPLYFLHRIVYVKEEREH